MNDPKSPPRALRLILIAIGIAMVAIPVLMLVVAPHSRPLPAVAVAQRVVPRTELPAVEPVELQAVAPEDAKAFNDTVPFSTGPNPAARPFVFAGDAAARARAIDCLAVGVLYEAGDDTEGERAVAQVILNRVRHPAFPKSVCGVIFQGSERSTGCQFSFACDGAMGRWHPNPAAWDRARYVAIAALSGSVYSKVGYATHYHTDWVVPYWSASLDKVTAVKTHLFFRWTGWWGTPPAFLRSVSGFEPGIAALDGFSAAHSGAAAALAEVNPAEIDSATLAGGNGGPQALSIDPNSFLVTLDPRGSPDSFPQVAAKACGSREYCKLMAWTDKARTPRGLPLGQAQISTMAFSYLRDKARGYEKALWNCGEFKRASKGECMKLQVLGTPAGVLPPPGTRGPAAAATPGIMPPGVSFSLKPAAPDGLGGVRRKDVSPKPAATPAPTERP